MGKVRIVLEGVGGFWCGGFDGLGFILGLWVEEGVEVVGVYGVWEWMIILAGGKGG